MRGNERRKRTSLCNRRLVWSSEQETLFLLEKFPGGTGADGVFTEAYQTIDVNAATLGNVVAFSNGNTFVVGSHPSIHPFTARVHINID